MNAIRFCKTVASDHYIPTNRMKAEASEHQEGEDQNPPPQLPSAQNGSQSDVAEIEHPNDDDDVHFVTSAVGLTTLNSSEVISSPDQQPDESNENSASVPTASNMSDPQPSNPTVEYTIPIMEGSERSTASYRGFMYRNRHGMTGSSGTPDEDIHLARLVRRDLPFSQSRNRVIVRHNQGLKIFRLIRHDWFHVILRYPKGLCLLCLLSIWTFFVIIFAFIYVAVDNRQPTVDCGLGKVGTPIKFGQSFAFSLETTTTGTIRSFFFAL
jgi:hypothetical protein